MRLRMPSLGRLLLYGPIALFAAGLGAYACRGFAMPGTRHQGPLPPITDAQRRLGEELRRDVTELAERIGERNVAHPDQLEAASRYIATELGRAGLVPIPQEFTVRGVPCRNLAAELPGTDPIVIVGAHYDSALGTPGADDNASGVAALLALARRLARNRPAGHTVRLVAFVNEEPPFFRTREMGSVRYAEAARVRGDRIAAMLSLEMLGYYSDAPDSQRFPPPLGIFYPTRGDFIGFVSDADSVSLVRRVTGAFRDHAAFPALGAALPDGAAAGLSDHWAFWQIGVPAIMVTDTAMLRTPHYHEVTDRAATVDFERTARVVEGLEAVVRDLVRAP